MVKIAHYLKAGCQVKILFADLHAFLDIKNSTWSELDFKTQYYEFIIKNTLKSIGVSIDYLEFIRGTEFQLSKEYTLDVYKLMSITTLRNANKAGSEVVKQSDNITMNPLLYPGLQALDEEYLDVDIQAGGTDQRKIFIYAEEHLPKIGYKKRIHLMNKIIPSMSSTGKEKEKEKITITKMCSLCQSNVNIEVKELSKMNSSSGEKIDLLASPKNIKNSINKAFCEPNNVKSGIFIFIQYVLFPILELKDQIWIIERNEKFGGNIEYKSFNDVCISYLNNTLHPIDLKSGVSSFIINILEPVRKEAENKNIQELISKCYK